MANIYLVLRGLRLEVFFSGKLANIYLDGVEFFFVRAWIWFIDT